MKLTLFRRWKNSIPATEGGNTANANRHRILRWPDPVIRLTVFIAVLGAGLVFVYRFVVPESYKDPDSQVQSVISRETAKQPKYVGAALCASCHTEQQQLKEAGYHRQVSCENCHGPGYAHVENPVEVKPSAPRDRQFCPTCHAYSPTRPIGFPQINPVSHNPRQLCISCHQPHDPKPPTVPGACTACHAQIERMKAVSPHALVECATCHATPEEHKVAPRLVHPEKPTDKAFCGGCHGRDAVAAGVPTVDVETHGGKYVCWQCHYPHMPEVHS